MGKFSNHKMTSLCYILGGTAIILFQFMPEIVSLVTSVCASGLFLGSNSTAKTLILIEFYGKDLLSPALAIETNFLIIGPAIAPIILTSLLDRQSDYEVAWDIGAASCFISGTLIVLAGHLNKVTN